MNRTILSVFLFLVCAVFVIIYFGVLYRSIFESNCGRGKIKYIEDDEIIDFNEFDNDAGTKDGKYIIPNYVHFLRFQMPELSFMDAVCILAAFKNQRPKKIFIHTDVKQSGKYWDILIREKGIKDVISFEYIELPKSIYGKTLNPDWLMWHASDVARLRILMKYGGIFLDNDSYIVRSLNDFRRYELVLGWMENSGLANQVILAHRQARFLTKWLESFKEYNSSLWYYNAGIRPTKDILEKEPYLIHREKYLLANHLIMDKLYMRQWDHWRTHYAIHLLLNHQYLLVKNLSSEATFPVIFDETNIHYYPNTVRDMVYEVYPSHLLKTISNKPMPSLEQE